MSTRTAKSSSTKGGIPAGRQARSASRQQLEDQLNVRLPSETSAWLTKRAGGRRAAPAYVRQLIEDERARESEAELLAMFNRAAEDLTAEDREERRLFMQAHPDQT